MKKEKNIIPIVFTFDDNYTLPAAVAIESLMLSRKENTEYKIYCLYKNLSYKNRQALDKITKINWIRIKEDIFSKAPHTSEYPVDVYYRLAIHDVLPQYDRIIYSDVDVLFQDDLTEVFNIDLNSFYWAGVPLERNEITSTETLSKQVGNPNDPHFMSGHTKFKENKNGYIFASGFMVINAKKMRADKMTVKFLKTIKAFSAQLKMFDLEVLNLTCQENTIKPLSFKYCVLEDIVLAKNYKQTNLYPFLSRVFSDQELKEAIDVPIILHYTGSDKPRIWLRKEEQQPLVYKFFFNKATALLA